MCGACRVEVGGQTRFVCVDGPKFDGHQVDWDQLLARQRIYLEEERLAMEEMLHRREDQAKGASQQRS
jgi:ferredoxin--NADP+ reductase